MNSERIGKIDNILKAIGIVIGVISISINIWQYYDKEAKEKMYAANLLKYVDKIFLLEAKNAESDKLISEYQVDIEEIKKKQKISQAREDSLKREAIKKDGLIEDLQKKLDDEKPIILNVGDDEHVRLWLDWTSVPK